MASNISMLQLVRMAESTYTHCIYLYIYCNVAMAIMVGIIERVPRALHNQTLNELEMFAYFLSDQEGRGSERYCAHAALKLYCCCCCCCVPVQVLSGTHCVVLSLCHVAKSVYSARQYVVGVCCVHVNCMYVRRWCWQECFRFCYFPIIQR